VALSHSAARLAPVFLGDDLLAYLVLALGGALFAGNLMALVKPPPPKEGDLEKAPVARSVLMGVIGLIAAVWALASLIS
jgi:hypothetical protein